MAPDKQAKQENDALLSRLRESGLEFVIIGGVCVVYHGALIATFDLDICCAFTEQNLRRIESAVKDLHPYHRLAANKLPLELTSELCTRLKNLYLQTDLGKLDCLGEVAGLGGYEEVRKQSTMAKLPHGEYRFLNLEALIQAKLAAGRDRDLYAVKHLRAIHEKSEQQKNESQTGE